MSVQRSIILNPNTFDESDINILKNPKLMTLIYLYVFPSKDELYYFLVRWSKKYGIEFLQDQFEIIDKYLPISHLEMKGMTFKLLNSINQHESGVNQIIKLSNKSLVTISDDCSMKLWRTASTGTVGQNVSDNDMKVDYQVQTETTTCLCSTGLNNDILVTGCHSGNINIQSVKNMNEIKTIPNSHQNLVRVLQSL